MLEVVSMNKLKYGIYDFFLVFMRNNRQKRLNIFRETSIVTKLQKFLFNLKKT
jgi:hypothetical protein